MSERVLQVLEEKFPGAIVEKHSRLGDDTAVVAPARWLEVCRFLREDPQMDMNMFIDLCGADYPDREPRFEVVLHLYSIGKRHRVRLKTRVGDSEGDDAVVDSITAVWPGANWFEREAYDMFGITFRGHPDLRRILMYPEFEGFPLRKDYPAEKAQPLIPYRTEEEAGLPLEKLAPFCPDEGMPFGRNAWRTERGEG
jgi:NADH-quinone oxidoreductase subunit C